MNDDTDIQGAVSAPPNSAVATPDGDLVAATLPPLRARLTEMVASGILHLTLDFRHVGMVDSMGIGLLVSAHNSLRKAGGALTVIHASKDILDLFRAMRIQQHFSASGN
jgi:anti-anti-sigma factor